MAVVAIAPRATLRRAAAGDAVAREGAESPVRDPGYERARAAPELRQSHRDWGPRDPARPLIGRASAEMFAREGARVIGSISTPTRWPSAPAHPWEPAVS